MEHNYYILIVIVIEYVIEIDDVVIVVDLDILDALAFLAFDVSVSHASFDALEIVKASSFVKIDPFDTYHAVEIDIVIVDVEIVDDNFDVGICCHSFVAVMVHRLLLLASSSDFNLLFCSLLVGLPSRADSWSQSHNKIYQNALEHFLS